MAGSIGVKDVNGRKATITVPGADSLAKVETFAGALQNFMMGGANYRTFSAKHTDFTTSPAAGPHGTVDDWAVLTFDRLDATVDESDTFTLRIPTPKTDVFEDLPGIGKRVTIAVGAAVQAALNTASGRQFRFSHGVHVSEPKEL